MGFIWRTRWPTVLLLWKSSARSGSVCVSSWCSLRGGSLVWGSTSHGRCSEPLLALSSHEVKEKRASEGFSSGEKVNNNSPFLFFYRRSRTWRSLAQLPAGVCEVRWGWSGETPSCPETSPLADGWEVYFELCGNISSYMLSACVWMEASSTLKTHLAVLCL